MSDTMERVGSPLRTQRRGGKILWMSVGGLLLAVSAGVFWFLPRDPQPARPLPDAGRARCVRSRPCRRTSPPILRRLSRLSAGRDVSQGPLAQGNSDGVRLLPRLHTPDGSCRRWRASPCTTRSRASSSACPSRRSSSRPHAAAGALSADRMMHRTKEQSPNPGVTNVSLGPLFDPEKRKLDIIVCDARWARCSPCSRIPRLPLWALCSVRWPPPLTPR